MRRACAAIAGPGSNGLRSRCGFQAAGPGAGMNCAMPSRPAAERAAASKPLSASSCAASSAGGSCSARAARAISARSGAGHVGRDGELAAARAAALAPGSRSRRAPVQPPLPSGSTWTRAPRCGASTASPGRRRDRRGAPAGPRTRDRRPAARAVGERPRELLQAGRREPPHGQAGRREGVVDQARAVESALGPALTAPHVRPAELRERGGDDRSARVEAAHVGEAEALRRRPAVRTRCPLRARPGRRA